MSRDAPIGLGATLGVFGDGQLGRMFVAAAARMGYRTAVFAPEADGPATQIAHTYHRADYDDRPAVEAFAKQCDVVTIEWENIPVSCLEWAGAFAPTRPGPAVLSIAQDRLAERAFLDKHNLPAAAHAVVEDAATLAAAVEAVGRPGVLKSATLGYDGRGQAKIDTDTDPADAWRAVGQVRCLYEAWVEYQLEVSVLVARSPSGQVEAFGPIENHHANHILDVSIVPARVEARVAADAVELARTVAQRLDLQGLICVEMFVTPGGLLINELAPRPHNSGHLTIEACQASQFEQQVRAICDLPLAAMRMLRPAAMANLLDDVWSAGEPDWNAVHAARDASLHLYGKTDPRPGRKMGHLTTLADTADKAEQRARDLLAQLRGTASAPAAAPSASL